MKEVRKIIEDSKETYKGNIKLEFYRKMKNGYRSFSPEIATDVQLEIYDIISECMGEIENLEIVDYNPIGNREKNIERCNTEFVGNYNALTDSEPFETEESFGMNKTNFYSFVLQKDEKQVIFLRRYNKLKSLKKGFFAQIVNNTYQKVENEIVGMDNSIDLIIFDETIYIINHTSLERVFDMDVVFTEKASIILEKVRDSGKIENFEEFRTAALRNGNVIKRLTKTLADEGKVEGVLTNFENINLVNENFETDFKMKNDKLLYDRTKEGELNAIICLLQDAYYQSHILGRQGIDDN